MPTTSPTAPALAPVDAVRALITWSEGALVFGRYSAAIDYIALAYTKTERYTAERVRVWEQANRIVATAAKRAGGYTQDSATADFWRDVEAYAAQ